MGIIGDILIGLLGAAIRFLGKLKAHVILCFSGAALAAYSELTVGCEFNLHLRHKLGPSGNPQITRKHDSMGAVLRTQFAADGGDMHLYRGFRQIKFVGDLLVGLAFG